MGVLVNYTISLSGEDLKLIGEALDAMPYGRVGSLVNVLQSQINAQEAVASQRAAAGLEQAKEALRQEGRAQLLKEQQQVQDSTPRRAKPKRTPKSVTTSNGGNLCPSQ